MIDIRQQANVRTALVFGASFLGIYWAYRQFSRRHIKLPPGPYAFPIVGNMPQLAGVVDPWKVFLRHRAKYGDVVMYSVGSLKMVVVCGYKTIREVLIDKGHCVSNRPNWLYIIDKLFNRSGVFWSNGETWKNMRRFTLVTLRDFGVGKKSLEERIQEECMIMVEQIDKKKGQAFDPKQFLAKAVSNIICTIVFGTRFDHNDPEFNLLLDHLDFLFKNAGVAVPENFFPFMAKLRSNKPAQKMIDNDTEIQKFVLRKIEEHRRSFDPTLTRDFIDMYLKVCQDETETFKVSEKDVFRVTVDLFLAGSETTATSLRWVMLYWIRYPEIQERCYQNIMEVAGDGRLVNLTDKVDLVYLMGFLNEVLRVVCIAPTSPPRAVNEEFKVNGYTLEKDTMVLCHIKSAHFDPDYWDNPEEFNPDRWIGPDGKLVKHRAFMPFGAGVRACMGESLSYMELFLFAANLLPRYQFKVPDGRKTPSLEGKQTGVTMQPEQYDVIAVPR
ncbi:hypothetical protein SNE40_010752 [Patella caerulea]